MLLLLCIASPAARADCPAAPIGDPDDMAISFLKANGVQMASASLLASSVKEGTLVYDDSANKLKVCNGTAWGEVGSGADTLASLSCSTGQIAKYNGTAWACAADVGGSGGGTVVAFDAYKSADASGFTWGAGNVVLFDTERLDTNNNFDTGTSRFTPTVAGNYLITTTIDCGTNAANGCYVTIRRNGVTYGSSQGPVGNGYIGNSVSVLVPMNGSTDYVDAHAQSVSGTIRGAGRNTHFSGFLIGSGGSDTLAGLSCTSGQIAKWNGTTWACAADDSGGTGSVIVTGRAWSTGNYSPASVSVYYDLPLSGGNALLSGVTHSTSTNPARMTVTSAGKYLVSYGVSSIYNPGGSTNYARVAVNGTAVVSSDSMTSEATGTYTSYLSNAFIVSLSAGDYVTLRWPR